MALLYGSTGSLDMARIGEVASTNPSKMLWIGTGLLLIGLFFKVAVVPFHQWVPDVYTGAPTNVTGFMAAATKTVAIAVLLRFLVGAFSAQSEIWVPMVTWLAILTMTVGNLCALAQTNLKRMLAYSSIAHAGYLLIGVVSLPESGVRAVMFYLTGYAIITVGAFAVLASVGRGDAENERGYQLSDWSGLGWERPMLGAAMAFFLFSLAGMPPTGGFFGKFVIFQSAIESGHYMLAIIGMLNATVAIYYYLRVIVMMYMTEPETDEFPMPVTAASAVVMVVSIIGILYLGLAPGNLLNILTDLASSL
jgi:NADH-quinone oxidoreductase subunit N